MTDKLAQAEWKADCLKARMDSIARKDADKFRYVAKMTVTKLAANRFVVEGVIAVIAGRQVNEAYQRVFTTKAKADYDAERWDKINKETIDELNDLQKRRLEEANEYIASRKNRAGNTQLSLF